MARTVVILVVLGLVVAGVAAPPVPAQLVEVREPGSRFGGGLGVVLGVPVGEFGDFVKFGGGLDGYFLATLERSGAIGLRVDGRFIVYGSETVRRPLSETIRRVTVDVTTTNFFVSLGAGPQWMVPRGRVRPYAFGTVGLSYFATESSVRGDVDFSPAISSTNFDDVTWALSGGGGLIIRLSSGRTPVSLDLSGQFLRHGETRYLREGGIEELPDGFLRITPIESTTNMVLVRIGVALGFR